MHVEALLVHREELARSRVKEYLVGMTLKRTDKHIGHEPFQPIVQPHARLTVEVVATVGDDHPTMSRIDLAAQAFVEQVEAEDSVVGVACGLWAEHRGHIVLECQTADGQHRQFHHCHRVEISGGVATDDIAQRAQPLYATAHVD